MWFVVGYGYVFVFYDRVVFVFEVWFGLGEVGELVFWGKVDGVNDEVV